MNPVSLWNNVTGNSASSSQAIRMHQFDQITSDKNFLLAWLQVEKYQFSHHYQINQFDKNVFVHQSVVLLLVDESFSGVTMFYLIFNNELIAARKFN